MSEELTTVYRKEYKPYEYSLQQVEIVNDIGPEATLVETTIQFERDDPAARDLFLHGEQLELVEVELDDRVLNNNEYAIGEDGLTIFEVPDTFKLKTTTRIFPEANSAYMGLYRSDDHYVTQCEAEGFRRITYFPDRPDVLTTFTTKIVADAEKFPVMLSNGNRVGERELPDGRRLAEWHDPFKKPSYLYAMVAGDFDVLRDTFVTMSGREVALAIYAEKGDVDKCQYAMDCLKNAMKWDEEAYGREYDLDLFNIVAINRFNMGAMENKSLNVFVSNAVLANPDTATDGRFRRVESVVAHEYFHNWSGNRITCRDWFQLSLKEGFTVFRDAHFSEDMNNPTTTRVDAVLLLKQLQFPEDKSPVAHAILQDSYQKIENFYTYTTYEKGAEVVRMLRTLLGRELFRQGTDHYFDTYDGQAVTIDEFLNSMTTASGVDLTRFRTWYTQTGNASVDVVEEATGSDRRLKLKQECVTTKVVEGADPFIIPIVVGIVDSSGRDLLSGNLNDPGIEVESNMTYRHELADDSMLFELDSKEAEISFRNVPEDVEISFLRDFSAPVSLSYSKNNSETETNDRLHFLAKHDGNGFVRIDSCNSLYMKSILDIERYQDGVVDLVGELLSQVLGCDRGGIHRQIFHVLLSIPNVLSVLDNHPAADIGLLYRNREKLIRILANAYEGQWESVVAANPVEQPYQLSTDACAVRSMRHLALGYLAKSKGESEAEVFAQRMLKDFRAADNLTDRLAAFSLVIEMPEADQDTRGLITDEFFDRWKSEPLVIDEWFRVLAQCSLPGGLDRVQELVRHPEFDEDLPSRFRSVYAVFAERNIPNFHSIDGAGYEFFADAVIARDTKNPQVAARLAQPLTRWQRYDPKRRNLILVQLQRILDSVESPELKDLIGRAING